MTHGRGTRWHRRHVGVGVLGRNDPLGRGCVEGVICALVLRNWSVARVKDVVRQVLVRCKGRRGSEWPLEFQPRRGNRFIFSSLLGARDSRIASRHTQRARRIE
jgi:hypothetical protein